MKWKIGNIEIKNRLVLAPMAGISNPAYMKICEEMGVGYVITELLSAEAIVRNNQKTFDMLKGIENLKIPYAIQIFGSNPKTMGQAAKIINNLYPKAIIDINMGCPVLKVAVKNAAGSALLKDSDKASMIVKEVIKNVKCPVTIKMRIGWDQNNINAVSFAVAMEKSGVSAISIHGRTRSQGYSGKANWNIIREVKKAVNVPVIGNGDITSFSDAEKMLNETLCDAVMIGRAALGNPWIFKECLDYLQNQVLPVSISIEERINTLKKHYKLLLEYTNEKQAMLEIRLQAINYLKGLPNCSDIKNKICQTKNANELISILDEYQKSLD